MSNLPPIEEFWEERQFTPNEPQREAILYAEGPLFLTAGPGSGKTRVLLWRTLNLLVYHDVKPEEIFLATFTEKAATQLKDGLRSLLGLVTNRTGQPYDISGMALGTAHSICRKIITDRRFSKDSSRRRPPMLLDELSQYFKLFGRRYWSDLCLGAGFTDVETAVEGINKFFNNINRNGPSQSRHLAVNSCLAFFNRLSEETLEPKQCIKEAVEEKQQETFQKLIEMYRLYLDDLKKPPWHVDFSLLQKAAYEQLVSFKNAEKIFKHVIIDEYQDTNAIQEKIYFTLAKGHKNICVVGDDDQALYRFRGAAVENLVEFESRCEKYLGVRPVRKDLDINYRSRKKIVEAYTSFIGLGNWKKDAPKTGYYRIHDKKIKAYHQDDFPSVIVTDHTIADNIYKQVAHFIYDLKKAKKIEDYSQCAFLFPSLWDSFNNKENGRVEGFKKAFEEVNKEFNLFNTNDELKVYAPRAGRFLEVNEAEAIWGILLKVFGMPKYDESFGRSLANYREWMKKCLKTADELCDADTRLKDFVSEKNEELKIIVKDHDALVSMAEKNNLNLKDPFKQSMKRQFYNAGLSKKGEKNISGKIFDDIIERREAEGNPFSLDYIISRVTSLDWSILDLFYQICGFKYFSDMWSLAEDGTDEGPVCNLSLISQYLSRFMEQYGSVITGGFYKNDVFAHCFFSSFTYALYRRGESEYEDSDDPFPKGRVSFLTIHQSKGLEFPVVVLGNCDRRERDADVKEIVVRGIKKNLYPDYDEGEPLERISRFDNMRMFYVALSRAKNVLILPRFSTTRSGGVVPKPEQLRASDYFIRFFNEGKFPTIPEIQANFSSVQKAALDTEDLGKTYSYTSDYLLYERCPRQYMMLRQYGFVPSRSQTMLFGSLVHETIEDLHYMLINERKKDSLL
ncbi:MAG: ATP-dependent helicase [Treponema sp.]|nr:ATP-dependent helicase [Treponema sp.]